MTEEPFFVDTNYRCFLRKCSLKDNQPLFEAQFLIECDDPLKTVELVLPLPTLPHVAGVHALELLCDDQPIGSHRIIVEEVKEGHDGDDSSD